MDMDAHPACRRLLIIQFGKQTSSSHDIRLCQWDNPRCLHDLVNGTRYWLSSGSEKNLKFLAAGHTWGKRADIAVPDPYVPPEYPARNVRYRGGGSARQADATCNLIACYTGLRSWRAIPAWNIHQRHGRSSVLRTPRPLRILRSAVPGSTARIHCDRKKGRYRVPWDPIASYWSCLHCGDVCGSERPQPADIRIKRGQLAFRLPATAKRPCWVPAPRPAAAATRALVQHSHPACIKPYSRRQSHHGYDLREPERHFDHEARFYGQSVESLVCWSRSVCEGGFGCG